MEKLLELLLENSARLISKCDSKYIRYFAKEIDFSQKMIGIVGARGVGKTTAILQYLQSSPLPFEKKLYISADMIEIADVTLFKIASVFERYGGRDSNN